jgi:phage/plasmid-like protein (TIGR03299 family)
MAHELEIVNGQAKMAYVGETPWHGLGVRLENAPTPAEMLVAAGLDWEVEKRPLNFVGADGSNHVVKDQFALVRGSDDTPLTIVGKDWAPVQNKTAFSFFNSFVEQGAMEMHTAGSLFGGRQVWALAKMKEGFEILNGDRTEGYFMFMNPHVYGAAIQIQFTPVRVVCNNTLTYAMNTARADKTLRVGHRMEFDGEQVKMALGLAEHQLEALKEKAQFLAQRRAVKETMEKFFSDVFPKYVAPTNIDTGEGEVIDLTSRNAKRAFELVDTQPGAQFAPGSWWQAFNAVTYLLDHERGRDAARRFSNNQFGPDSRLKQNALKLAIEAAELAPAL